MITCYAIPDNILRKSGGIHSLFAPTNSLCTPCFVPWRNILKEIAWKCAPGRVKQACIGTDSKWHENMKGTKDVSVHVVMFVCTYAWQFIENDEHDSHLYSLACKRQRSSTIKQVWDQYEVPCSVGNVINSALFINSSWSSLSSTSHAVFGGGFGCGGGSGCKGGLATGGSGGGRWSRGRGGGDILVQLPYTALDIYHMVLRPKGTSHNKPTDKHYHDKRCCSLPARLIANWVRFLTITEPRVRDLGFDVRHSNFHSIVTLHALFNED